MRFFVDTDPSSVVADGAYVDDVLVKCIQPGAEGYEAIAGTSMASPHVAGAAALLLAAQPTLTVAKLKNALLKGVDKKAAFANRVSTGGRLNVDRSIDVALDVTPPDTTITARPPSSTRARAATFRFRSNQVGSTFQCRHMMGPWVALRVAQALHRASSPACTRSASAQSTRPSTSIRPPPSSRGASARSAPLFLSARLVHHPSSEMGNAAMRLPALMALAILLFCASGAGAGTSAPGGLERHGAGASSPEYVPGEVIVRFRAGHDDRRADQHPGESPRGSSSRASGLPGATLVRLADGVSVESAVAELESDPDVLYAEPNYIYRLSTVPNDPHFDLTWGLSQANDKDIDAPAAWTRTRGSSNVLVAVIDSGIAYSHPDLAGNMWLNDDPVDGVDNDGNGFIDDRHGWDFVQNDAVPLDYNGHGTHVAGTIGAVGNNARGVPGVNWDVSLMALRAADANGSLPNVAIVEAINYACANGADVVNGSFGGSGASTTVRDAILSGAVREHALRLRGRQQRAGTWTATPASTTRRIPASSTARPRKAARTRQNILCIGATDRNDVLASFSNHGTSAVHLAAPGVDILQRRAGVLERDRPDELRGHRGAVQRAVGQPRCPNPNPWNRTGATRTSGAVQHHRLAGRRLRQLRTRRSRSSPRSASPVDRLPDQLQHAARHGQHRAARVRRRLLDHHQRRRPISGWSGSTSGDWFAFSDDFSGHDGDRASTIGLGHGCRRRRRRRRRRLHRRPRRRLPAPQRQRVPVPRRHLDGDAARRRRRGTPAGATTRP